MKWTPEKVEELRGLLRLVKAGAGLPPEAVGLRLI